jgi:hypothetical protein
MTTWAELALKLVPSIKAEKEPLARGGLGLLGVSESPHVAQETVAQPRLFEDPSSNSSYRLPVILGGEEPYQLLIVAQNCQEELKQRVPTR